MQGPNHRVQIQSSRRTQYGGGIQADLHRARMGNGEGREGRMRSFPHSPCWKKKSERERVSEWEGVMEGRRHGQGVASFMGSYISFEGLCRSLPTQVSRSMSQALQATSELKPSGRHMNRAKVGSLDPE